jgi:hypothetical protein
MQVAVGVAVAQLSSGVKLRRSDFDNLLKAPDEVLDYPAKVSHTI